MHANKMLCIADIGRSELGWTSLKRFRSLKTVFRVNLGDSTQADTSSMMNRVSGDSRVKHSNNVIMSSRARGLMVSDGEE